MSDVARRGARSRKSGPEGVAGRAGNGASGVGPWRRGWAAPALVFFTSAAVLVLEILAARLVAPYVGVTLETYTGVIGTVLAGIAIGAAVGGRLADRVDPRPLLGPLLIAGGAASIAVLPIISALGPVAAARGSGPVGIVTLALAAFVLPTSLLSAVTPMIAKLRLASTAETGTVVGSLSAAGTAGALVGTFTTGFVLVAALPTRAIVVSVGSALAVVGIAVTLRLRRRSSPAGLVAFVIVFALAQAAPSRCQRDTAYYCATVGTDPGRSSGRFLVLDNLLHGYVDLDDPVQLELRVSRVFAAVIDSMTPPGRLDALHIGGGAFILPRWIAAKRPGSRSTVLELDPGVVALARDQLGLRRVRGLRIRTGDARVNLSAEASSSYDVVIGDAFGGRSVPWHLTTVEMVRAVRRTMRPGGVYVVNMIDGGPRRLVRAELATLATVFANVGLVTPPNGSDSNQILVASDRPLRMGSLAAGDGSFTSGRAVDALVGSAKPLRDDYAPVDQLLTRE